MVPRMDSMDDEILALCKFYRQQAVGVQQDCGQGQAQGWPPPDGGRCLPRRLLLRGGGLRRAFGRECSRSCLFSFVCESVCMRVCLCAAWGSHGECTEHVSKSNPQAHGTSFFKTCMLLWLTVSGGALCEWAPEGEGGEEEGLA